MHICIREKATNKNKLPLTASASTLRIVLVVVSALNTLMVHCCFLPLGTRKKFSARSC